MKYTLLLLIAIFFGCQKSIQVPELSSQVILDSSISERGIVDGSLLKTSPKIKYTNSGNEYTFTLTLPAINSPNPQDYTWHHKWYYLLKKKSGVKSISDVSTIKLIPVDILSVQIESYVENKYTGVKSNTLKDGIIVDLTGSKIKITKK